MHLLARALCSLLQSVLSQVHLGGSLSRLLYSRGRTASTASQLRGALPSPGLVGERHLDPESRLAISAAPSACKAEGPWGPQEASRKAGSRLDTTPRTVPESASPERALWRRAVGSPVPPHGHRRGPVPDLPPRDHL